MKEYRQSWNQDEDQQLQELYKVYGDKWKKIAELLHLRQKSQGKIRTAAACRERYQNILKPTLNKNLWTREEEEKLFSLQKLYGNCWTKITIKMRNRSELICKNYFYATIRRVLRRLSKQVGILKPSQMLKSIKPSVLMSIYLEDNQETQLVFNQEVRLNLKQLITKYQFIQKEENIPLDNEETKNIRQLIRDLVDANIQYLEFKGRFQIQKKNKLNFQSNKEELQKEQENIIKRIRLQEDVFVMKYPHSQNQIQKKEQTLKDSSCNENKGFKNLIANQNSQIPESYFSTQQYFNLQQTQAYFQTYMDYSKYNAQYQFGNYFDPYSYFYYQQTPYQFQLQQRI
ncbi:unnamed protein product (macronuclear) [Paramecium tetraurelia]|uniref:Myb-like DNA-binding domain protein n=1 Tax=Paramecium tetraurelia TaxID=5888 RepID=A0E0V6_PARTE|nr:uncharacterized protein GSPATT00022091001 [Paramecium tetraurelia]CAK88923.1 unnamed protein product [Paramecium tetraurelia]|eukprot:XP_001456320.1 hypothetical protein (macronuclear) [Paramecium tetraurelia strain d4-2]